MTKPRVVIHNHYSVRDELKSTHADFIKAKQAGTVSYATGLNEGWVVNLMGKRGGPFKTEKEAEEFYHRWHFVK